MANETTRGIKYITPVNIHEYKLKGFTEVNGCTKSSITIDSISFNFLVNFDETPIESLLEPSANDDRIRFRNCRRLNDDTLESYKGQEKIKFLKECAAQRTYVHKFVEGNSENTREPSVDQAYLKIMKVAEGLPEDMRGELLKKLLGAEKAAQIMKTTRGEEK